MTLGAIRMEKENRFSSDKKTGESSGNESKIWGTYSDKIGESIAGYEDEDTFLDEVNSSLAEQISMELEDNVTSTKVEKPIKKARLPKGVKIFATIFSVIMLAGCLLAFTPAGKKLLINLAGNYIYGKLKYEDSNTMDLADNDENTVEDTNKVKPVEHIVNILLLGVEEIEGASNTDVMIVATMDTKNNSMKLTSLMRDLYVEIPGYNNNKLNSVYAKGGIDLLYQTIKNNFGLDLDGYVLVNFDAFEKIVDLLGGVEVTLTSAEANYLNTTNYISNPANRNVKEGTQILNGNQALGYCRVRYVSTSDKQRDDFGRTSRQRTVLNSIFNKMKKKNILQLGLFMNDVLNKVDIKTDITNAEFNEYLEEAASLHVSKLDELRIPTDGSYTPERLPIGRLKQDVLVPKDWNQVRTEIHDFIYGSETVEDTTDDTIDEVDNIDGINQN
jgi:polyisoprenyl-teichoic acid--peptidoglycan teichoic acid transferase